MSEIPKIIPISQLTETNDINDMWVMVSKQVGGKWDSFRVPLSSISCTCTKEPLIEPDRYEDLPKNERSVYHTIVVVGSDPQVHALSPLDYDKFDSSLKDMDELQNGYYPYLHVPPYTQPSCVGTYKVLDCDEISVFGQSLRVHTSKNPSIGFGYMGGLDVRQSDLDSDKMFGSRKITLPDYDKISGGYYAWGNNEVRGLLNNKFVIYKDSTKKDVITQGWDIISRDEWLQLICQAPRHKPNQWDNIKDFFFGFSQNPVQNWDNHFLKYKNISGLSFFPSGVCQNVSEGYARPLLVNYFGTCAVFASKLKKFENQSYLTGFFENTPAYSTGVWVNYWLAWGGNIRYSRIKTPEELGYRLVSDNTEDKILFVPVDWVNENTNRYAELPVGGLRGTALRYANREHRIVTRSYSSILLETQTILSAIRTDGNA